MANLTLPVAEPGAAGAVHFLPLAPEFEGASAKGHINLYLQVHNAGSAAVRITQIKVGVTGSSTPPKPFATNLSLGAGGNAWWTQTEDYVFVPGGRGSRLQLTFTTDDDAPPVVIDRTLVAHSNPTADGCYRFWARADDLRADEWWRVHGTDHGQSNPAQLFAHDVVVGAYDASSGDGYTTLLPGTDGSQNTHHRIWGKPVHAIAAGTVVDFRDDFPTNALPGQIDPAAEAYWKGAAATDGNGNFFTIAGGGETVLYAHMQPGTLNPKLLAPNAVVQAGDFLGLAGNSGASSGPHMHIHAVATGSGGHSWTGYPRPLLFKDTWEVTYLALAGHPENAPWVHVDKRGLAPAYCAVWPAAGRPGARFATSLQHLAVTAEGQLWTCSVTGRIRTASAKVPARALWLDIDPGGQAFRIAVRGTKPWTIGSDHRLWEGRPDGWFAVAGSPECTRLALDPANGTPWVVRADQHIVRYDLRAHAWIEHAGGGLAKDICVSDGTPYVIGMDDRVWKSAGNAGWSQLPGTQTAVRIASDPVNGTLWLLDAAGTVWSGKGDGTWNAAPGVPGTQGAAVPTEIAACAGRAYVIGPTHALWIGESGWGWWRVPLTQPNA